MTSSEISTIWGGKPAQRVFARITLQLAEWYELQFSGEVVHWFLQNEDDANALDVTFEQNPVGKPVLNFFRLDARTGNSPQIRENSRPKAIWVRRGGAGQIVYFEFIHLVPEEDVS